MNPGTDRPVLDGQGCSRTRLLIEGMRDNRCRERIRAALLAAPGVQEAEVSLVRGLALVLHQGSCAGDLLVGVVTAAGFRATVMADRPLRR